MFGKLPSHGDFLRRRASDAFVDAWDAWLRECLAASREALGERWLDVYLTSPAWRFVCAAGACGPAPVIGLMVPSVDRVGRYFPLTLVAELPDDVNPIAAATASAAFFDRAERLIIETLATDDIDFERFDEQVVELGDALEAITVPPRVVLDPAAAAMLGDGAQSWQIPIGSAAELAPVFEQLLSQRLSSMYEPLVLWWTEGSSAVEPSCLIAKGLPHPNTFVALLDGSWAQYRWRPVPARVDTSATLEMRVEDADAGRLPIGRRERRRPGAQDQRGRIHRTAGDRRVGGGRRARRPSRRRSRQPHGLRCARGTGAGPELRGDDRRRAATPAAGQRAPAAHGTTRRHACRSQRQHRRRVAGARDELRRSSGRATAGSIDGGRAGWNA